MWEQAALPVIRCSQEVCETDHGNARWASYQRLQVLLVCRLAYRSSYRLAQAASLDGVKRTQKQRGENRPRLSLRGKHRGERLKARVRAWQSGGGSKSDAAFHRPGSSKK